MTFDEVVEEYLGDNDDSIADIRAVVRRLWFYDFVGYPVRVWQGQGKLFTTDGKEWLGTVNANNVDLHETPAIKDGRDGSSPTMEFGLNIVDYPGQSALQTYDALKADQWRTYGQRLVCYLAVFKGPGEGLRPETPITYFKEFTMQSVRFSEKIEQSASGAMTKRYRASVIAKDGNVGRANTPGGTYADAVQKERARQLGAGMDRGCEFVALLANRTYQLPD